MIMLINSVSHLAVGAMALRLGLRLRKEKGCSLKMPVYFLAGASLLLGLLNMMWFADVIELSAWDHQLVGPLFNLIFLGVWFYVCFSISGHRNINYLIAFFVMGVNTFLVVNDKALVSDLLMSLVLLSLFFHVGLLNRWFAKKLSFAGMAYALLIAGVSAASYFMGLEHLEALWFIPNLALLYLIYLIYVQGSFCNVRSNARHRHIPVMVEIAKFGVFVSGLCVLLMVGMLGVHELGHSLAAGALGCEHETELSASFAMTHVECGSSGGSTLLVLGGLIMTLMISLLMFIAGNGFIRRTAYLLLAFSLILSMEDLTLLGVPNSSFIVMVFIAAILIGRGLMLIVRQYEYEYEVYEKKVCSAGTCMAAASAEVASLSAGGSGIEADLKMYGKGGGI